MKPSSTSSSKSFRVHLTGTFSIASETQSIHLPTRKIESLFAYLILHPEIHSREKLAALFWGDSSETAARGSLRKALTFLRKKIDEKVVLADRETVQLNASLSIWVDIIEFQDQAQKFLNNPIHQPIHIIVELYQGDLLVDFYDEWILSLREHYLSIYIDVLLRATEQSRSQSEYNLAIDYAHKILAVDPANERAHQHLMFCYIMLGDRNKALQQYEACQRALQDELAVEPTRETQALHQWIKQVAPETQSLAARLTNLPIPISSFVGRNKELLKVKQLLSNARLVTLTGAGGSGKTRLAIHASTDLIDSFKDGVWWVELARLTDPSLLPSAVAKALGIDGRSDQPLTETLKKFLYARKVLLVLDNCEHLIDACAQLSETLLTTCTGLKILTTSRETLGLTGEHIWQVPALSLPDMSNITLINLLMKYEGIRLFAERANAINSEFIPRDENAIAIAQICQRLDGIPLAIELAAARIKTMSVEQISDGLADRFQLLSVQNRTSQTRHQTLRATVDWSYDLLTEDERLLFCRLSIFSGGWTLDAAEAVCSGKGIEDGEIHDLLTRLADKSLITVNPDSQRFGMLETMRQYGDEKLILAGEQDQVFSQYLDYFLKKAEVGAEKVRGRKQISWHIWFKSEYSNLASVMEKALDSSATLEKGCQLVCAMCWHWGMTGDFVEMKHWLEIALSRSIELEGTPIRAEVLFNAGSYSVWGLQWLEPQDAKTMIEDSLEIWRNFGTAFVLEKAQSLLTLGYIKKSYFDDERGLELINESIDIFKKTGASWWHAWALNLLVTALDASKDFQTIKKLLEEEIVILEELEDQFSIAVPLIDLGVLAMDRGKFADAQEHFQESLHLLRKFEAKGFIIQVLAHLGDTMRGLSQYDQAGVYYEESIPLASAIMWEFLLSKVYLGLGYVALNAGDAEHAGQYFDQALRVSQEHEQKLRRILCVAGFASVAAVRADMIVAARLFGSFFSQLEKLRVELDTDQKLLDPVNQIEVDKYLSLCKTHIESDVFERAWNEGSSITLYEVIDSVVKKNI